MARPMKYSEDRVQRICKAISEGETYEKAAKIGGINYSTFCAWRASKIEFSEAVKRAKEAFEEWELNGILADAKKSLKTLITGVEYEEIKTEYVQTKIGSPQIAKQIRTTKRIPPSPTAVIFALCNRDPENWKNRISNEIAGKVEMEQKPSVSLANVPDDLLAQVIEALNK